MTEETAALTDGRNVVSVDDAPPTLPDSSPRPSTTAAAPSPNIGQPRFHFRSTLTATPTSSSSSSSSASPAPPLPRSSSAASSSFRRSFDESTLQRRRIKERKSRIQQTFLLLSSCSIVLLCLLLVYYNYLLLAPQLTSLFWAVLFSLLLSRPQQLLAASLERLDVQLSGKKATITMYAAALSAIVIGLSRANTLVFLVVAALFVLLVGILYGERQHLVSLFLLLLVVFLLAFPLAFFLKTGVDESREISIRVRAFITDNPAFEHLLRDFTSSSYYSSLLSYAQHLGLSADTVHSYLDPASLKDRLASLLGSLSDQLSVLLSGALSVLAQLGNTVMSVLSFLGALYWLLDNRSAWLDGLLSLSPFSEEENARLGSEMRRSVQSIFICSFLIGLLHMVSTFIAFSVVGLQPCLILSFLAGWCAMLPIFTSWLVWLPAIITLLCLNRLLSASLLLLIQLFLCYYLDPLVYGRIRPEQSSLIGMSIVFGIGAFGSTGVVVGPLLTTVTLTLCNIYVEYCALPLPQPQHARPADGLSDGGSGKKASGLDGETSRLSAAGRVDRQWTAESFPTFFHAAADTPAATLRKGVQFAPLSLGLSTERGGLHGFRSQQTTLPTPHEPSSPLAWQTNPLGQSKPPSTAPSALSSPVAATPSQQPSLVPTAAADEKTVDAEQQPLQDRRSEKAGKRCLLIESGPAATSTANGLSVQTASQPQTAPLSSALQSATDGSQSARVVTETVTSVAPAAVLDSSAAAAASSASSTGASLSAVSLRRPAAMRPLRTKEEDDDPSTVPAAVYIHESDEEGPDSGFDLTAEVVDSQRERKQRVIILPRSTRARKKNTSETAE